MLVVLIVGYSCQREALCLIVQDRVEVKTVIAKAHHERRSAE